MDHADIAVEADAQPEAEASRPPRLAGTEPIPGYRLLEPLGRGGFGEVWKCEVPGGLLKAIKFVLGKRDGLDEEPAPADEELQAIQRVKVIRHPFILSMERVESVEGELVIVMELADKNLHDLLREYRAAGQPGIPRDELLCYLREAAEALDLLHDQHNLQHLDVKPRNLFLVSNHVKVGDFGLVSSLGARLPGQAPSIPPGAVTPLYSSPETFQGSISRHSDQYSLAIVYQELLTDTLPFNGKSARHLMMLHCSAEPDLSALSAADRALVERALSKDWSRRFPSCAALVQALSEVGVDRGSWGGERRDDTPRGGTTAETPIGAPDAGRGSRAGLSGYRLLENLARTPLTEVWKVQAPDGRKRLVKYVYGLSGRGGSEAEAARLRALRHPTLVPAEVVQADAGRLVLATDLVEKALRDRLQECQAQGLPGIPRRELLGYLRPVAEALGFLYRQHGLQHLGLNPRNLFLDDGRPRIADFGLAQLVWLPAGQAVAKLNARYAAPELFDGKVGPACDQFGLALIYHELLTGLHCRRGGGSGAIDLGRLLAAERDVLARALAADPKKRWPSCTDLVQALAAAGPVGEDGAEPAAGTTRAAVPVPAEEPPSSVTLSQVISELVAAVTSKPEAESRPADGAPDELVRGRFSITLAPEVALKRLEALRQQYNGQKLSAEAGHYVFRVTRPGGLWQRYVGRQPALRVDVRLGQARTPAVASFEVSVQIRPFGSNKPQGAQLLREMGNLLLESTRSTLQAAPWRRTHERLVWHYPLQVRAVQADGALGGPIECQGKDISAGGIGFYLPEALPTSQVEISLPQTDMTPAATVPASIVRVQRCGDGWYEVGALFLKGVLRQRTPA